MQLTVTEAFWELFPTARIGLVIARIDETMLTRRDILPHTRPGAMVAQEGDAPSSPVRTAHP